MDRRVARNLSVANDVLRLPSISEVGCILSGGCLLASHGARDAQETVLDGLMSLAQGQLHDARHWLMVGHDSWQPDTRITRHHKLWGSMAKRISLPTGQRSEEFLILGESGIKFFGYIDCDENQSRTILEVLRSERACTLVLPCSQDAKKALTLSARRGWSRMTPLPPREFIDAACSTDLLLYAPLGAFDDRRWGCAIVARPPRIDQLFGQLTVTVY